MLEFVVAGWPALVLAVGIGVVLLVVLGEITKS